jgi:hypothetical protein
MRNGEVAGSEPGELQIREVLHAFFCKPGLVALRWGQSSLVTYVSIAAGGYVPPGRPV